MQNQESSEASIEIVSLSNIPDLRVNIYSGCIVNGVRFFTKERDDRRTTQNSGVVVPGVHDDEEIDFYGRLCNVVELTFLHGYEVILFQCDWFDTNPNKRRIQRDYDLISINVSTTWYGSEPFVFATQASQVFYVDDYKLGSNWKVVQKVKQRNIWDVEEKVDEEDILDDSFTNAYQESDSSDVHVVVQEEENREDLHIIRTDIDPEIVVDHDLNQGNTDNIFDYDDASEGEDDTLAEYNSDSNTSISDDDTDGEDNI